MSSNLSTSMARSLRRVRSLSSRFACIRELQNDGFTPREITRYGDEAIVLEKFRRMQLAVQIRMIPNETKGN